ncbi:steroidogenic factor 1-like [Xyrichtys novacula]|uniref:Steroidogenic factor 1-like n=1 Tax=Xyrichtys novacula TaxID=13765 RepID=A0AAV1GC29_XYRNO|nr:steroidogenic factor 1-like [Xyrichtys novacula]
MELRPDDLEDMCPVCGDKVSGYHYGLLTCESCKGFFKRTVQNNKTYVCAEYQECRIDKTQRRRCPFCRFQKCLHVGMRLEAVRADRMRGGRNKFGPMYKRDRALKQQRKALFQRGGVRSESTPPLISSDWALTEGLYPVSILHSAPLPTLQSPFISLQPPSLSPLLTPISPAAPLHHNNPLSNWTLKSKPPSTSSPSSAAGLMSDPLNPSPCRYRTPQLVLQLQQEGPDELQLQEKVSAHFLKEKAAGGEQWTPTTFSLMCIMADQTLLHIVEWARTSTFLRRLRVSDQMKLLQSCWCNLLLLDVVCRQVLYGREGRLLLVTGQEIELSDISSSSCPIMAGLVLRGQELIRRLLIMQVDHAEFTCIRFLILFNPDVPQLEDHQFISSVQEQVEGALLEYTLSSPSHLLERFSHLLLCVSELRSLSALTDDYLYGKHLSGEMHCNNLLLEMLHAKHDQD